MALCLLQSRSLHECSTEPLSDGTHRVASTATGGFAPSSCCLCHSRRARLRCTSLCDHQTLCHWRSITLTALSRLRRAWGYLISSDAFFESGTTPGRLGLGSLLALSVQLPVTPPRAVHAAPPLEPAPHYRMLCLAPRALCLRVFLAIVRVASGELCWSSNLKTFVIMHHDDRRWRRCATTIATRP